MLKSAVDSRTYLSAAWTLADAVKRSARFGRQSTPATLVAVTTEVRIVRLVTGAQKARL